MSPLCVVQTTPAVPSSTTCVDSQNITGATTSLTAIRRRRGRLTAPAG